MNPWPIAPITDKDLNFAVVDYDFVSFTAAEQAELPGLEGAIDLTLIDFAASIADQTVLIASLFNGLDELGLITNEIDSSDDIGNTLSDLATTAAAGDQALNDYAGFFTAPSTGGGGGGALPAGCAAVAGFDTTQNTPPFTRSFSFTFGGANAVLTVDAVTLTEDTTGLFSMTHSPLGTVPPGQVFNINVTLNATAPQGIHGKIVTTYHIQDNVKHDLPLCLGVDVPDNFPQPSSGGGGSPGGGRPICTPAHPCIGSA